MGLDCLLLGSRTCALESVSVEDDDTFLDAAENFSIALTKVLDAAEAGLLESSVIGMLLDELHASREVAFFIKLW